MKSQNERPKDIFDSIVTAFIQVPYRKVRKRFENMKRKPEKMRKGLPAK